MACATFQGESWKSACYLTAFLAASFIPAVAVGQDTGQVAGPSSSSVPTAVAGAPSRLRAADPRAAALLRSGLARSATFRAIVETIEASDLIIYIETRDLRLPGQLQLLAATPGCRHLRISVRVPGLDTELVAWLGHELWHAVELADAPEVRDQSSVLRLYQRIGMTGTSGATAETAKAQEVWTTVLYEARAAGRPQ